MSSRAEPGLHRLLLKGSAVSALPLQKGRIGLRAIPIPRCARGCPREKRLPGVFGIRTPPAPPAKTAKRKGGPLDAAVLAPKQKSRP